MDQPVTFADFTGYQTKPSLSTGAPVISTLSPSRNVVTTLLVGPGPERTRKPEPPVPLTVADDPGLSSSAAYPILGRRAVISMAIMPITKGRGVIRDLTASYLAATLSSSSHVHYSVAEVLNGMKKPEDTPLANSCRPTLPLSRVTRHC